jgi:hypothetical protein
MLSDWLTYFYPQIENPWQLQPGIFNLPWLYVGLYPLTLLGPYRSGIVVQIINLVAVWWICHKFSLSPVRRVLVLLSPPVVWGAFLGQFDSLLLLAYFAPVWFTPVGVLIKPQVNLGAVHSLRPIRIFALAALLGVSAFIIWQWPVAVQLPDNDPLGTTPRALMWNWAFWPLGLLLLPILFLTKDIRIRMFISPFLFPYAGVQSLIGPLLALATNRLWLFVLAWTAMWVRWWVMVNTGAG